MNFLIFPGEILALKPATIGQNVVISKWINAGLFITEMTIRPNPEDKRPDSPDIFPPMTGTRRGVKAKTVATKTGLFI
jgi:hypothetical protein